MNKVYLSGYIAREPMFKRVGTNNSGMLQFQFTVARPSREGFNDTFDCIMWNNLAEKYEKKLNKTMNLIVVGEIQISSYTHKSGDKIFKPQIVVESIGFIDKVEPKREVKQELKDVENVPSTYAYKPDTTIIESQDELTQEIIIDDESLPF
jgi:single-strand DNA-binding protein